jgi:heme A synthase
LNAFHTTFGFFAAGLSGVIGLWGVLMARRPNPPRAFYWAVGVAIGFLLLQVVIGVILANSGINPGNQHVFYGVVIAVTFTFAYIYRAQFRKRPALYIGLLLLFTMGLGIRGIMTFGHSF